jgi:peptidoglycan/xylan/chitin deacetylase (PgdA/CDA1 family)
VTSSETAVVITCFDLGRTLPEAIESVLAQTVPAQELVLVDDGSTDPLTLQVLDWIERHEPRVRLIRSEHRGAAAARNTGIGATTAPFVVLLDGDDLFEPTYLEQASKLLHEREDLSFVCCALQAFGRASYRWKPPPYTVAEALGRGACGHISTVFRRELWEDGPGFDSALPSYEDVDFWLDALRRGLHGVILDDVLLRYRVRQGSRYHSAVVRGDYVRAKELLLDKHLDSSRARGEDVLVTLIDFEREQTGHVASLRDERARIEEALAEVEREVEQTSEALEARDIPALRWSRPSGTAPGVVERHLMERMLDELCPPDVTPARTLRIERDDAWPATAKPAYDLVVLAGALERERDPQAALDRARAVLRPGGRLVVAAATMARGDGRRRGFTEASLRALLCDRFPPGDVRVAAGGNLMTCLCTIAGAPLEALSPAELDAVDPAHPTVVAGSARLPGERPRGVLRRSARGDDGGAIGPLGTPTEPPPRAAILCYHRVAALHPDVHHLCMPPERFAAHMELLAERFRPVPLARLAAEAAAGELRPGTVAVTFDDGYLDNFEVASPIAAELKVPVTFFVSGAPDDEEREGWWDTAERILLGEEPIPERLVLELADDALSLPTRSTDERGAALHALHGRLLHADPARIEALMSALAAWSCLDLHPRHTHRLMTAPELVDLAARPGHAIGAHGLHHLLLTAHGRETKAQELGDSKAALERILEQPVELLAYAYGGCDVETTDVADELGFAVACTVEPDPVHADADPLRLPRLELRDESPERLRALLEQTIGVLR